MMDNLGRPVKSLRHKFDSVEIAKISVCTKICVIRGMFMAEFEVLLPIISQHVH